jgi:hypothetical protein
MDAFPAADRGSGAICELHHHHFGTTLGLPPGLPGGGITGVLPPSGVGAWISESAVEGGHSTPPDLASLSPSDSPVWPVVTPSGAGAPPLFDGAQASF